MVRATIIRGSNRAESCLIVEFAKARGSAIRLATVLPNSLTVASNSRRNLRFSKVNAATAGMPSVILATQWMARKTTA
jgi:hypothetical protein